MRGLVLDARVAGLRVAISPPSVESPALGYESHASTGSAPYAPCDAMTGANMIDGAGFNRWPSIGGGMVTSQ
ncbi:hypothetical protein Abr02nite_60370 [Paractinoplanes brasiliensis]|nr:hypothetical protein Abr02nite_60370 [Actinoplanes brasiliensis]